MKEAVLYSKEGQNLVCHACLRKCVIPPNKKGFCGTRQHIKGKLYSLYYGYFSCISVEKLGSKPFLFFKDPNSKEAYSGEEPTLSIGGYGCNFQCKGCQNANVSQLPDNVEEIAIKKSPAEIIVLAKEKGVKIIAFTWNEPAIMPEIVLDIAKLAHKNGLLTVYVSNGSPTIEQIDLISPFIDAFRYDIKAGPLIGNPFYEQYCNLAGKYDTTESILATIKHTKLLGKHIELLTVLIPGYLPSCTRSVSLTTKWILENLGEKTPLHLAKFFPANKLSNPTLKTPDSLISYYVGFAKALGLKNVNGVLDKGCDCVKDNSAKCCC